MKKILILITVMGSLLSACLPAFLQSDVTSPTPISKENLEATAAVLIQQTLGALPTPMIAPSNTPVVKPATSTVTQVTQTGTPNPELLTITGSPSTNTPSTPAGTGTGTLPFTVTPSVTPNAAIGVILTETPHPQHYGTLPPYLPFGKITLINKSKSQVYISLQCTTQDGYTTIIEYPVSGTIDVKAPLGKYTYVAWVGGKKIVGKFILDNNSDLNIKIFKDHLEITKKK